MSGPGPVRAITAFPELRAASLDHPVVRFDVGSGFVSPAYAVGSLPSGALAFARWSDHGRPGVAALGSADSLGVLFGDPRVRAWVEELGAEFVTAPRESFAAVSAPVGLGTRGGSWDWMWTTTAPPVLAGESSVVTLSADCQQEVEAFLAVENPRTHGEPFARADQLWVGVREPESGRLMAVGCSEPLRSGVPTLSGIAVGESWRGQGWGAAVTAYLTRLGVASVGACTLGMYADNDVARRVYHRLGYVTGMEWRSGWFERST